MTHSVNISVTSSDETKFSIRETGEKEGFMKRLCLSILSVAIIQISSAASHQQVFIEKLTPAILEANFQIMVQRETLKGIKESYLRTGLVSDENLNYLALLGEEYGMKKYKFQSSSPALMLAEMMDELLKRVDVIPVQLVLAQGIIETGWGKSRSAQDTHNYFGITSSTGGSQYVVTSSATTTYYLASYADDAAGVKAYISLLNSKSSYAELRDIRAQLRAEEKPLDATALSAGLMRYSEMGQRYIDKVNYTIHKYLQEPELGK